MSFRDSPVFVRIRLRMHYTNENLSKKVMYLSVRTYFIDVSFQDVMSQLQCLLSAQLPLLPAEPEGQ